MENVSQSNCISKQNIIGTGIVDQQTQENGCKSEENHNSIDQSIFIKEKKLDDIKKQCSELIFELDETQDAEAIVKKHISQLKKYNELKDIALGLVTMIADQRKLRTSDILEEMKVELGDE